MKKLISMILAFTLLMTFASVMPVAAEGEEDAPAFVIDGQLDEWYRSDEEAIAKGWYNYFNGLDDTTMPLVSREFGGGMGEMDIPWFFEDLKVKIYSAWDENYAYFFVDVDDAIICEGYENSDGSFSENHQQSENIDFYVDTDFGNWDQDFNLAEPEYDKAETHFRLMADNLAIVDAQGETRPKYSMEDESFNYASGYFSDTANCFPFQKFDENGKQIGYGCEVRFPLVYMLEGHEEYTNYYYNIAVTNSRTDMDEMCCAVTTGYRWWLSYNDGITVQLDYDTPNPFFYKPDPDAIAAGAVTQVLLQLSDPPASKDELWKAYEAEEARAEYEKLTDAQKELVDAEAYQRLLDFEARVKELTELEDEYTPGDVDENKAIDAVDALWVLQAAVEKRELTDKQFLAGDMNEDNVLDATDALTILKIAVGK